MAEAKKPAKDAAKEFLIEQIYVDNTSFAAPTPVYRLNKEWKPNANLDLDVKVNEQGKEGLYEVSLIIKVAVVIDSVKVFDVSVNQSGLFRLKGYDKSELDLLLNSFCPNVLYPYARQVIADQVARASFPPLHLSPVDFDGRYMAMKDKAGAETK